METKKERKPKQYTHIDYEALLIYVMKNRTSIYKAIEDLELDVARSTIVRNINKIKEKDKNNEVISLYQNGYVPNMQKDILPQNIREKISLLPNKKVITQAKLEDLYRKLHSMKEIIDSCGGNLTEATRKINSGTTSLGNVKITRQGLGKDMAYYEVVKEAYEKTKKSEQENHVDGREVD